MRVLFLALLFLCSGRAAVVDVALDASHFSLMPANMGYGTFPSGVSMHAGPGDAGTVIGVACQSSDSRPGVFTLPRTAEAPRDLSSQTYYRSSDCPWCSDPFRFGRYTASARLPDGGFAFVAASSSPTYETTEGAFAFRTGASPLPKHRLRCGIEGDGISTGSGSVSMTPDGQYLFMVGQYNPSTLRSPVCVLQFNGSGYFPMQILESPDPVIYDDAFGSSMDTSGFTPESGSGAPRVVFGSNYRGGSDQGAIEVAQLNSSGLWELDYIFPVPPGYVRGLGRQVSISGDTVVTATTRVSAGYSIAARVFVYEKSATNNSRSWIYQTELLAPSGVDAFSESFGSDVAVAGDLILVGTNARTIAYARNASGDWEPIARISARGTSVAMTCEHAFFLDQVTAAIVRFDSIPVLAGRTGCRPPGASVLTTASPTTAFPTTASPTTAFPTTAPPTTAKATTGVTLASTTTAGMTSAPVATTSALTQTTSSAFTTNRVSITTGGVNLTTSGSIAGTTGTGATTQLQETTAEVSLGSRSFDCSRASVAVTAWAVWWSLCA